jgi:peptidoglycan/xylan/chitin deacetylase (PgdA/CDA1 family)
MYIRKQDLSVLMFYFLGYSAIRALSFRLQRTRGAWFVTFHDIPDGTEANLRDHLLFLRRRTNVVSFEDFLAGRLSSDRANVVITFDDGYKSWVSKAAPALKTLNLPATFFVSSGFVGLPKEMETTFQRSRLRIAKQTTGALSPNDVRQLSEQGFTIGGHTCTHPDLSQTSDIAELRQEICADKQRLETMIGREIHCFSYPFGLCHNEKLDLIQVLKEAGYKGAVTTASGLNRPGVNPYLLSREITNLPMAPCVFRARALGAYEAVVYLKRVKRQLAGRPAVRPFSEASCS